MLGGLNFFVKGVDMSVDMVTAAPDGATIYFDLRHIIAKMRPTRSPGP
jgi:hypothetical protein